MEEVAPSEMIKTQATMFRLPVLSCGGIAASSEVVPVGCTNRRIDGIAFPPDPPCDIRSKLRQPVGFLARLFVSLADYAGMDAPGIAGWAAPRENRSSPIRSHSYGFSRPGRGV